MKLRALLLALACTFAQAQDVLETTNLVNMWSWQGIDYPNPGIFSQCCSGGPNAAMNTSTNTLRFSYGVSTAYQTWQIDSVLPGSGIKISGFKYSWQIDNSGETQGTISANVRFASNTGALLENYNYSYGPTNGLTQYSGTELFASSYPISSLGQVGLAFTGKDASWWAGYYGPRVRDPSLRLLYTAGAAPPPPLPLIPAPIAATITTTEVAVAPTETLVTETVTMSPTVNAIATDPTTVTTLISSPGAAPVAASAAPSSGPQKAGGGPLASAAVSMVLRNNAAQQAALQSSNLATSVQQSQQSTQDSTNSSGTSSSDSVALGMSSFSTASRQASESMSSMDAANPTSTRNLLGMMTVKSADNDQQDREDRQARATAGQSSSASAVGIELGTGVSLAALATTPSGYSTYTVQIIEQTAFYSPREIYRNQRTVDNNRVRQGLSGRSDRLHQDMVDSQYKNNKGD